MMSPIYTATGLVEPFRVTGTVGPQLQQQSVAQAGPQVDSIRDIQLGHAIDASHSFPLNLSPQFSQLGGEKPFQPLWAAD